MEFRPTITSFVASSLYRLSGVFVAAVFMYFTYEEATALHWTLVGAMALFSFLCFVPCIPVHLQKLHIDEHGLRLAGPFGVTAIPWGMVTGATLRERPNVISRTDRLLTVISLNSKLHFPISMLREDDEERVLELVRGHVKNVVVMTDKPTI
jgi:hypothetical protein